MADRVFLKLGGALITDKDRPESVRHDVLDRLCREVAAWPGAIEGRLVLAHGSGSFAHVAAGQAGFMEHPADPVRLARVASAARRLNAIVIDALLAVGLPALPVPGSLLGLCVDGRVVGVEAGAVLRILAARAVPVVYGDAAPDRTVGGAIASTEPLLAELLAPVPARRIVLATDVDGIFDRDPHRSTSAPRPIPMVTPSSARQLLALVGGARGGATDVTGGMATKLERMVAAVESHPRTQVRILSGLRPGAVSAALRGAPEAGGTVICAGPQEPADKALP